MRLLLSVLSSLLTATVLIPYTLAQVKPAPPPTFETLFVGTLVVGESQNVTNGPFGTRMHGVITGWVISDIIWECLTHRSTCRGNLTEPGSGKLVATILPTADNGLVSNSGIFFS